MSKPDEIRLKFDKPETEMLRDTLLKEDYLREPESGHYLVQLTECSGQEIEK